MLGSRSILIKNYWKSSSGVLKRLGKGWGDRAVLSSVGVLSCDPVESDASLPSVLGLNESVLLGIHAAGVPWWLTIASSTLLLRSCLTLPIAVYQQRSVGKMVALAPMIQSWGETLKQQMGQRAREQGMSYDVYQSELQKEYKKKVNAIYAQYGCSRWRLLLLPYVQIPLFVSMSLTLRHLAAYPLPWYGQTATEIAPGLDQGGLGFFQDLTATDATWILPVLVGAGNLTNVELNAWFAQGVPTRQQKILTHLFRALSLAFIPIAAQAPSAISLYWVTSAWYSVAQNLTFRIPAVRSTLGMPRLPAPK
ncbi:60Kd inner membrane protein-domain-containing protein [Sporodiniella umbellata]|nr:60Kd inner membrane protein-domain-containing protein [Sporodiniella umbellata]